MNQINNPADAINYMLDTIKRNELHDIAQKIKSYKIDQGLCPECGTDIVRHDQLLWNDDRCEYDIWGTFKSRKRKDIDLEPGDYTCINDHHFKVVVIDEKGNTEIR